MFLLLCIDRVVVDAAVSFRGSSMIITQYGALSMHALENCVKHPLLMVELSTYHDGLTIGACFESGIHRDKKRKNKRQNAYRTTTRIYRACTEEHMHTSLHHRDYVCRSKPS